MAITRNADTLKQIGIGQRIREVTMMRENFGTVADIRTNRWGTFLMVFMDDGREVDVHSIRTQPGIGYHLA